MSELAYQYQDSAVRMETEGSVTRIFFGGEHQPP